MNRDPRDNQLNLLKYAAPQGGYFTAAQARDAGYTYRQQHYHKNRGNWQEIEHGLYRLYIYPETEHEDLIRWSLWSRNQKGEPQAVVSHDTALALHELGDVMPGKVHLTVPPGFRKKVPGGCILHKAVLSPEEIDYRQGFRITKPIRTLVDVADANLAPEQLQIALSDAINKGIVRKKHILERQMSDTARRNIMKALRNIESGEKNGAYYEDI